MKKRQDYLSNYRKTQVPIAATGSRDWQNAYIYALDTFQGQLPAVQTQFEQWVQCDEKHGLLCKAYQAGCPNGQEWGDDPAHASWEDDLRTAIDAEYEKGVIFSGAIFLAVSRGLKKFNQYLGITGRQLDAIGPRIGNASLLSFIHSAANNVRHYEDWREPNTKFAIDARVLRKAGITVPLDQNIANQALELLELSESEDINSLFIELANVILAHKAGPNPFQLEEDELNRLTLAPYSFKRNSSPSSEILVSATS